MKRILILLPLLSLFLSACGDDDADLERNLRQHVEFLASDECDGRLPFTEGAQRAVAYLASQMDSIGLVPVDGESGSYFQQVPLVKITTEVQNEVTFRTPAGAMKEKYQEGYSFFTHSLDSEIDIKNAELVFAGYGIVAPEYGKDDYAGLENPGNKIAVVIVNDPGLDSGTDYFRGNTMTYYGRWTYKFEEGARQGLGGVLIIHDDRGAGYGWSVARANKSRYVLDRQSNEYDIPLKGWLSNSCARELLSRSGYDPDSLFAAARRPDFKPFSLKSYVDVKMTSTLSRSQSPNVVGYIPSADGSDESIVCVAHWDHLGHSTVPVNGDDLVNGATDNATAVAWLLETARAFKKRGRLPKRNIVFLTPTCEEVGMYGSEHYASNPLFPSEKTVAVVNLDVIPLWGENNDVTITGWGYSSLDSLLAACAKKQDRYIMPDPDSHNGMFYRSDHLPFMRKGIPALFAKGWSDNRLHGKEWATEKIADYWANVYHTPADETHPETDDYAGLIQEVHLFYDVISRLADTDLWPQWSPDSEFQRQ